MKMIHFLIFRDEFIKAKFILLLMNFGNVTIMFVMCINQLFQREIKVFQMLSLLGLIQLLIYLYIFP